MATPTEVAEWMLEKLTRDGVLYPSQEVSDIEELFGAEHIYIDERGSIAISRKVLYRFKKLWMGVAEWDRYERCWRLKDTTD
jgi:hypothetical protein